eukprot:gene28550-31710_t
MDPSSTSPHPMVTPLPSNTNSAQMYKKLTQREHVLHRPGMCISSVETSFSSPMYQVVSPLSRQPSVSEASEASEVSESVSDAVSEGPDHVKSSASNAPSKGPVGGL